MAEESLYPSDHKRKYEDIQPPTSRRSTGFSAPISLQSPSDAASTGQHTVSYNNVPPPLDEIQLAKQKAQEIAARLLSSADPSKKTRVENGGGGGAGYDANEGLFHKTFIPSVAPSASSYGYSSGGSKKIEIPSGRVGVIIGKGGETIKYLQLQSGARIQVTRDMDADPNSPTRSVELMGTMEQISKAEQLIQDVLAEADTGGSGNVSRGLSGEQAGSEHFLMKVPNNKVGLVIGKGGETIKNMQARTGARIQVIPLHLPPGDTSGERTVQIDGTSEQIEAAKKLVNEVIIENRMRNQAMGGSYPQQGYQARPPTNWAPPGAPMPQPGYGYVQPGAYPGSAPSYNTNQPPYPGYPPPPSYGTGWDQTTASGQQSQGVGYDYYGQQQPPQQQQSDGGPGAPADNSAYASNQPPASGYDHGQVYPQDGYGGYTAPGSQSGYGQPPPNPVSGYDQQQGYNSTPGYGNASNPQPDSHVPYGTQGDSSQPLPGHSSSTGRQSYPTGQQSSPKSSYPLQGSTQPVYGVPPYSQGGYGTQPAAGYGQVYAPLQAQKPPSSQSAYGQPQQSPSSQGSYDQSSASHLGYPQQPTSSGYGPTSAQLGYAAPPYGAPPGSQPNWGQPQAPVYGANYAGGYSQPQVYPSDDSAGGSARGTSDSTPSQAAIQPGGATKTSAES